MKALVRIIAVIAGCISLSVCASFPGAHPAYIHALQDLRAAGWLIEHRPGDWARTSGELEAMNQIEAAIDDIKKASLHDEKGINDYPQPDELPDAKGMLHQAIDYLNKARIDVSQEEDNAYSNGLRHSSIGHIDAAILATERAIGD
jgi:tetratricopeptide (TPR) repeat protein